MRAIDGIIGELYVILGIRLEMTVKRRLEIMGMTEGALLSILNKKSNGSVIIKVRGTRLAVGRKIAEGIRIGSVQ